MAMLFLNLNASVPITIQWFLNFYFQGLLGQLSESLLSKHSTCVSKTYSQLQPKIGRLPGYLLLFTHLQASCRSSHCPNTSHVPSGLAPNLSLSRYSQCSSPGKLSESSLSKHLTCVSRTYSQPQPVEIFSSISKTCHLRQSIDKSLSTNDLTANMPQK